MTMIVGSRPRQFRHSPTQRAAQRHAVLNLAAVTGLPAVRLQAQREDIRRRGDGARTHVGLIGSVMRPSRTTRQSPTAPDPEIRRERSDRGSERISCSPKGADLPSVRHTRRRFPIECHAQNAMVARTRGLVIVEIQMIVFDCQLIESPKSPL